MARLLTVAALLLAAACGTTDDAQFGDTTNSSGNGSGPLDHPCEPQPDPWDDDVAEMIDIHTPDGTFQQALNVDRQFTAKMVAFLALAEPGCDWSCQLEILDKLSAKCGYGAIHRGCACDNDVCPWD